MMLRAMGKDDVPIDTFVALGYTIFRSLISTQANPSLSICLFRCLYLSLSPCSICLDVCFCRSLVYCFHAIFSLGTENKTKRNSGCSDRAGQFRPHDEGLSRSVGGSQGGAVRVER